MKFLAEMTWVEAQEARDAGAVVLVPIGSTEAHGPHLPLATDVIISRELCRRVARALSQKNVDAVIAPASSYAVTDYAAGFAGSVTLPAETATALIRDLCVGLDRQGFGRVVLVNSHLEPDHLRTIQDGIAAALCLTGRPVCFPDVCSKRWARTMTDEFKRGACHAGSYETSLVLAARPELVRETRRAGLPPKPIDLAKAMRDGVRTFEAAGADQAYFGDPAGASAEEGEEIYGRLVEMVLTEIAEMAWPA